VRRHDNYNRTCCLSRGWASYFRYAMAKNTFSKMDDFTFWRLARMLKTRHSWN
jgi:RNA-directed DNA polymerase